MLRSLGWTMPWRRSAPIGSGGGKALVRRASMQMPTAKSCATTVTSAVSIKSLDVQDGIVPGVLERCLGSIVISKLTDLGNRVPRRRAQKQPGDHRIGGDNRGEKLREGQR